MKNWNTDRIIGVTSFIISVVTLVLFLYEINLTRKQQYASVLPYLTIQNMGAGGSNYKLQLTNEGLGPAFIQSIKVKYKDKYYDGDPTNYLRERKLAGTKNDSLKLMITNVTKGMIVPVGNPIVMLESLDQFTSDSMLNTFYNEDTFIEVIYSSVYDEQWKITSTSMVPEKIE